MFLRLGTKFKTGPYAPPPLIGRATKKKTDIFFCGFPNAMGNATEIIIPKGFFCTVTYNLSGHIGKV